MLFTLDLLGATNPRGWSASSLRSRSAISWQLPVAMRRAYSKDITVLSPKQTITLRHFSQRPQANMTLTFLGGSHTHQFLEAGRFFQLP